MKVSTKTWTTKGETWVSVSVEADGTYPDPEFPQTTVFKHITDVEAWYKKP